MQREHILPAYAVRVLVVLAVAKLLAHALTYGGYGYFRDEFYYIACSEHLAAGYVDHPPLSILLLALVRWTLGDALWAIRLLPALAGAAVVVLTGGMARELGGGRFAQGVAALATLVAPVYFAVGSFYSMNAFEPLTWSVCAFLLIRLVNTGNARLWLLFGLVAGLGLQNKHSTLFFGFALAVAILLTPQRRSLRDPWLWAGIGLAVLLFVPNIVWQIRYGWPTLEFMRNAQAYKNMPMAPLEFVAQQILTMQPLSLPLWGAGLGFLFFGSDGRRYRLLGWIYVVMLLVFIVAHGKVYYLTPIYPMLFAAGATLIERVTSGSYGRWVRPAYVTLLLVGGIATAPLTLPVLPVDALIRYQEALGLASALKRAPSERNPVGELPQYFADRFGWSELVAEIARIYETLPPAERAQAVIAAGNYGEAGAIDFLGKPYHLPPAISAHNTYWLWGPRGYSGEVVIAVGASQADLARFFESVVQVGTTHCRYCMPFENDRPIYLCRQPKQALEQIWPLIKRYT